MGGDGWVKVEINVKKDNLKWIRLLYWVIVFIKVCLFVNYSGYVIGREV